jgi:dienelactone hydrolase
VGAKDAAILILPGGANKICYSTRAQSEDISQRQGGSWAEGDLVAEHFASLGYRAYVLVYRTHNVGFTTPDAGTDAARALALVRSRESEKHIHALGFSAGAFLALGLCMFEDLPDAVRPDSAASIYGALPDPIFQPSMAAALGAPPTWPPKGITLAPTSPPIFAFATEGDIHCPSACVEQIARVCKHFGVPHRTVVWPNIWNDDKELEIIVRDRLALECGMKHGQSLGVVLKDGTRRTWTWVAEFEEWLAALLHQRLAQRYDDKRSPVHGELSS